VVFEGTILETLLINRLNGTFAGPVDCLVTTNIYSHDRQQVLIPAGTKVLGEAKKVEAFGHNVWPFSFTGSSCRTVTPSASTNSRV